VFLEALMGIAIWGEHLEDGMEKDAVIRLLVMMKNQYAIPTNKLVDILKRAWELGMIARHVDI
jgi:hypothetical protein